MPQVLPEELEEGKGDLAENIGFLIRMLMDGFWFDSKTINFACPLIYLYNSIYNSYFVHLNISISFALEFRPLNDFESPNPQGKKDEKMEKVAPTILQVRKNILYPIYPIDSASDIYNFCKNSLQLELQLM